jgi:hypothetical protein
VKLLASLAEAAETPTEIRLLNKEPLVVGIGSRNKISNLSKLMTQLECDPSGQTPICKHLYEISEQLRNMENELRASNKKALLIIMTDCESSDGDIVDVLKPLEGLPLQIIIRICSHEKEIIEHWQHINAQLDLEIYVLREVKAEADIVTENNSWVTYGEPLHRLREFGVMVPAIDKLNLRQLSKLEIRTVAQILVGSAIKPLFPDPNDHWDSFVTSVCDSADSSSKVFCPVNRKAVSWINNEELSKYVSDPVRAVVEKNEILLWKIFIFYAYNATLLKKTDSPSRKCSPTDKSVDRIKTSPVFRTAAKYEKKIMNQDDLWQLFKDFDFIPIVVNTIRFNKMMLQLNENKHSTIGMKKSQLCFREFIKVMEKLSDVAYPYFKPAKRIMRLLIYMEKSGNLRRMMETGKVEGVQGSMGNISGGSLEFQLTTTEESGGYYVYIHMNNII